MTIKASNFPTTRPSLDLNFAQTKRLDPRVTFSRASSGTYTDVDGLIKSAATNVARFDHNPTTGESLGLLVEEARTNRTVRSQGLGLSTGNWFTNNAFCADNQGIAPDGTFTASRLVPNAVNAIHYVADATGASLSGTATVSVFAKADGYNFILLAFDYASGDGLFPGSAYFDLSTGQIALGASTTGSIQQLTNGWYRCTITATAGSTVPANPFVAAANSLSNFNFAGNGTSGILLWGFQFESGSFPTSYIPTPVTFTGRSSTATFYDSAGVIQTAASGVARSNAFFPDSSGVFRPAGLLLEAAATNIIVSSQVFNSGGWTLDGASLTANAATAPDGTTTATSIVQGTGNNRAYHFDNSGVTGSKVFSIFAKANAGTSLEIRSIGGVSPNATATINLSSGTVSGFTGATVQSYPNGWYRVLLPVTVSTASGSSTYWTITGPASSVLIWGAQLEAGSFPTSYIPTTTATVTRAADTSTSATVTRSADVAQITGTNFSSWWSANQFTLFADARIRYYQAGYGYSGGVFGFGTGVPRINFGPSEAASRPIAVQFWDGTTNHTNRTGNYEDLAINSSLKMTLSFNGTSSSVTYNSRAISQVTSAAVNLSGIASLKIGEFADTPIKLNGTISRLAYWPVRLSDTVLQAITR